MGENRAIVLPDQPGCRHKQPINDLDQFGAVFSSKSVGDKDRNSFPCIFPPSY